MIAAIDLTFMTGLLVQMAGAMLSAMKVILATCWPAFLLFFAAGFLINEFKKYCMSEEEVRAHRLKELRAWKKERNDEVELEELEAEFAAYYDDEIAEGEDPEDMRYADADEVRELLKGTHSDEEIDDLIEEHGDPDLSDDAYEKYRKETYGDEVLTDDE